VVSAEVGPSEVLSLTTPYSSNKDCGRRGTWVRTVVRPGSLRSRAVAGDPTHDLSIVSRTPSRWATAPRWDRQRDAGTGSASAWDGRSRADEHTRASAE